jgi:Lar family restriction alleviation protein
LEIEMQEQPNVNLAQADGEAAAAPRSSEAEANRLQPCPFCGNREVSVYEGSTFRWRYAACDSCGAQSGEVRVQTLGDGTKAQWEAAASKDAIDAWNTRAASSGDANASA